MDGKELVASSLAFLLGAVLGAGLDTLWERPRLARRTAGVKIVLDEGVIVTKERIEALRAELAAETQRRQALEQVSQQSGRHR
jgi:hypothetical protein